MIEKSILPIERVTTNLTYGDGCGRGAGGRHQVVQDAVQLQEVTGAEPTDASLLWEAGDFPQLILVNHVRDTHLQIPRCIVKSPKHNTKPNLGFFGFEFLQRSCELRFA